MIDEAISRLTQVHTARLVQGAPQVFFRDLIVRTLPPFLWDYLTIVLNPALGGVTRLGSLILDLDDQEVVQHLEEQLMGDFALSAGEVNHLVEEALRARVNFILDPAGTIANIVFPRQSRETLTSETVCRCLASFARTIQQWNPGVAKAVVILSEHLKTHPRLELSIVEFTRQLRSAVEKEFSTKPLQAVDNAFRDFAEVLDSQPDAQGVDDYAELAKTVLAGLGLWGWTAAVEVEREMLGRPLSREEALKTLRRLNAYRERGVLAGEAEDRRIVEEELAGFTEFIQKVGGA